jgi:subtilisin family serine protease
MLKRSKRVTILAVLSALSMLFGVTPVFAQTGDFVVPGDAAEEIAVNKVESTYLVMMAGDPAASYTGGVAGYAATRPADGEKLDVADADVRRYRDYLRGKGNAALRSAGIATSRKLYDYGLTFNGFSARLTGSEAAALSQQPGVLGLVEDELRTLDTISTTEFLGLTGDGGAWDLGFRGQNVIVGILDSGIWPENPSFQPTGGRYGRLVRWSGICQTGQAWDASDCNGKLIGARYYNAGWGGDAGISAAFPYEYNSPRDADGHGSHTAATAAGAGNVEVVVDGQVLGTASGMAPLARIAAYKVCWGRSPEGGCFSTDSVAAVEQAVADGVDVINFSISGTSTNFLDPVEIAFLGAADAGVFVAASAGNTPGASTVNHPSPWITTVAAGTHDRYSEATLTLGDGSTYTSASFQTSGTPSLPLVYSGDVGLAGAPAGDPELCVPGSLDPALVEGKMVLCERGVIARVDKSLAVRDAGGLAMILANTSTNSINGDIHFVPTIHVDEVAFAEILAYIGAVGDAATGELSPGGVIVDETAPQRADFSSQGPLAATGDLLKPDIIAPGVDVLAAYSPDVYGRDFDLLSGTSMSSPHIAGLAAVIKSAYRGWTPDMIKSAMMTTAYDIPGTTPFDDGSGHVDPTAALDPGLVYKAGFNQYVGFMCGTGQLDASVCTDVFGVRVIDPSNLNQPNIAIGELAGSQTVTRRVTNVSGKTTRFDVSVDAPAGVDVTVSPSRLTLKRGQSATYRVTFTRTSAPLGEYAFGTLTWSSNRGHDVTSQLAVQPVQLSSPAEVSGSGAEGSIDYGISFGYTGAFTAAPHGLVAANLQEGNVVDDPANDINTALGTGVGITLHEVVVPEGTAYTRIALFDDYTDGEDDLDLYVFGPDFGFVGGSGSGTSEEEVNLVLPGAGTYFVVVHGWQTDGPDANYTLFDWSVSATPADGSGATDLSVTAPTSASLGASGTVSVSWNGLEAGQKYLGAVSYTDDSLFGLTVVSISNE